MLQRRRIHRSRLPLRGLAVATAFAVGLAGSGLPMCLTLVAQATAGCPMHSHEHGAAPAQSAGHAELVPSHAATHACHPDTGLGCATGGTCPTGGVAAPALGATSPGQQGQHRQSPLAPDTKHLSYLRPPLSPPPQA